MSDEKPPLRETPKAAAAFTAYCEMENRSLAKLAGRGQSEGKAWARLQSLEHWSSEHHWQERVRRYDAERAEERRRKREAELDKMDEEHALMGHIQALRAVKQVQELIEAKKFGSQAAVQLFKVSTDLERVARGAATERTEVTGKDGESFRVHVFLPETTRGDA